MHIERSHSIDQIQDIIKCATAQLDTSKTVSLRVSYVNAHYATANFGEENKTHQSLCLRGFQNQKKYSYILSLTAFSTKMVEYIGYQYSGVLPIQITAHPQSRLTATKNVIDSVRTFMHGLFFLDFFPSLIERERVVVTYFD